MPFRTAAVSSQQKIQPVHCDLDLLNAFCHIALGTSQWLGHRSMEIVYGTQFSLVSFYVISRLFGSMDISLDQLS